MRSRLLVAAVRVALFVSSAAVLAFCAGDDLDRVLTQMDEAAAKFRSAQANFLLAAGRLGKQKIGEIRAGDQKHQADNRHHQSTR